MRTVDFIEACPSCQRPLVFAADCVLQRARCGPCRTTYRRITSPDDSSGLRAVKSLLLSTKRRRRQRFARCRRIVARLLLAAFVVGVIYSCFVTFTRVQLPDWLPFHGDPRVLGLVALIGYAILRRNDHLQDWHPLRRRAVGKIDAEG